jgi:type IV secretory pathway VirB3-like protein
MSKKIAGILIMLCGAISMFFIIVFVFTHNDIGWLGWLFTPFPVYLEWFGARLISDQRIKK